MEIFTEPVLVTSHSRNHRASGHLEFDMTFRSLKEHAQLFFFFKFNFVCLFVC